LAIGTTEFVMMGLLPAIARDFDVSIPQAGYDIAAYALGVVIGAPLLNGLPGVAAGHGGGPTDRLLRVGKLSLIPPDDVCSR
jgi:hypothetical protein